MKRMKRKWIIFALLTVVVLGAVTGTLGLLCIRNEQRIVDWLHRRRDQLTSR